MNKHRTHQIDELAQRFLEGALPPSWVPNEQHKDYGKDYLVEIGEDNNDLSGASFYIQLKGQEKARMSADGSLIKYSLESKYAKYYCDKIKDLPVFLVVVDVSRQKGWWVFLQPILEADQTWRGQSSITIKVPIVNDVTATASFRKAVEEAKKWMRLHHPESIHESVVAHKERITGTDPRFDVNVSLVNDQPMFTLLAKEIVPLSFTFTGDEIDKKISDLLDKGALVAFRPGEIKVTGSKLFDEIEQVGCAIQAMIDLAGTLTLICRDGEERELARLSDVPGQFSGGRKELWFEGVLVNSPMTVKLGPIGLGMGGSVQLNLNLHRWDGQRLLQLAYFDKLNQFFQALPKSILSTIECQKDGNSIFCVTLPLQTQPFAAPLARYLETISKARSVAQRFNVNPAWTVKQFDQDAQETADQLYAIFYENGWSEPKPHVRLTANCIRKTLRLDVAKKAETPSSVMLTSDCSAVFFGTKIEVGRLAHVYSEMSIKLIKNKTLANARRKRKLRAKNKPATVLPRKDTVAVALVGTRATVLTIRMEEQVGIEHKAMQ